MHRQGRFFPAQVRNSQCWLTFGLSFQRKRHSISQFHAHFDSFSLNLKQILAGTIPTADVEGAEQSQ